VLVVAALLLALAAAAGYFWGQSRASPAAVLPQTVAHTQAGQKPVDPYVAGPLKNTLRKNALALQELWLQYLKEASAKPQGSMELDWTLDAQGKPSGVGLVHSDFANPAFEAGVLRVVAHMQFPPPGQELRYVSHRFVFKKDAP
jgi:TonB family protein